MFAITTLPQSIPIFPLESALLLPRGHLPLHIFEPRFLAMVDDALCKDDRLIGLVQPVTGAKDTVLHDVGCAGRITSFTETPEQAYMITLTGVSRFRLGALHHGFQPYQRADVHWSDFPKDMVNPEKDPYLQRDTFLKLLNKYFHATGHEVDAGNLNDAEDELLINALSMLSPFEPEDKQALLEAKTLTKRREILMTLMEFAIRGTGGIERLQ